MDYNKTLEKNDDQTLSYSEQLTEQVKVNHHKLQLEKQLIEAKKHFQKKSKGELIDLILNMTSTLDKKKRKYYKSSQKSDLIAILIKNWIRQKTEINKKVEEMILTMPKNVKEKTMKMAESLIDVIDVEVVEEV